MRSGRIKGIDNHIRYRSKLEIFIDYMDSLAHAPDQRLSQTDLGIKAKNESSRYLKAFQNFATERGYVTVMTGERKEFTLTQKGLNLLGELKRIEKDYDFSFKP
ncbi:hypothetical protein A3K64_00810 [Candidatus Micrarchaeota archaeon RBG_16_36_9]|nr:MAG: hypothetical protein A3K64_00810 [Candidatus Micrarchaeota archaeon RBG_16_36_9]